MALPSGSMVSAVYFTADSKEQVVNFYKHKLGSDASVFNNATGASLAVSKNKQESVVITITTSPSQNEGKTQIQIVHTISNKPS